MFRLFLKQTIGGSTRAVLAQRTGKLGSLLPGSQAGAEKREEPGEESEQLLFFRVLLPQPKLAREPYKLATTQGHWDSGH